MNVPDGIKVIKAYITAENPKPDHVVYVGVRPNSQHTFNFKIYKDTISRAICSLICLEIPEVEWVSASFHPKEIAEAACTLEWSPEINKKTPTVTDYN
jgi:hypothetical protein